MYECFLTTSSLQWRENNTFSRLIYLTQMPTCTPRAWAVWITPKSNRYKEFGTNVFVLLFFSLHRHFERASNTLWRNNAICFDTSICTEVLLLISRSFAIDRFGLAILQVMYLNLISALTRSSTSVHRRIQNNPIITMAISINTLHTHRNYIEMIHGRFIVLCFFSNSARLYAMLMQNACSLID